MKQYTVKDFITYNNPCFSCGENIHFNFMSIEDNFNSTAPLRPTVRENYTTVNLKMTYQETLQLQIIHSSNRFASSNPEDLKKYLTTHNIYLTSTCNRCLTFIESEFLQFNFDKGFILPFSIRRENIMVTDEKNQYNIYSLFDSKHSIIYIDRIDNPYTISSLKIDAPLLPLYKFRDREHLISKMKTYLIFS